MAPVRHIHRWQHWICSTPFVYFSPVHSTSDLPWFVLRPLHSSEWSLKSKYLLSCQRNLSTLSYWTLKATFVCAKSPLLVQFYILHKCCQKSGRTTYCQFRRLVGLRGERRLNLSYFNLFGGMDYPSWQQLSRLISEADAHIIRPAPPEWREMVINQSISHLSITLEDTHVISGTFLHKRRHYKSLPINLVAESIS